MAFDQEAENRWMAAFWGKPYEKPTPEHNLDAVPAAKAEHNLPNLDSVTDNPNPNIRTSVKRDSEYAKRRRFTRRIDNHNGKVRVGDLVDIAFSSREGSVIGKTPDGSGDFAIRMDKPFFDMSTGTEAEYLSVPPQDISVVRKKWDSKPIIEPKRRPRLQDSSTPPEAPEVGRLTHMNPGVDYYISKPINAN